MSLTCFRTGHRSSKTTEMLKEVTKFSDLSISRCTLIINYCMDDRNLEKTISSHSSIYKGLSDKVDITTSSKLSNIDVASYKILGIDEAQWLNLGKYIVIAGLDGNFKMEKYGSVSDLVHLSDKFIKLTAVCVECMKETLNSGEIVTPCNEVPAPFTKKLINDKKLNVVGDLSVYAPVCRKHHK